MEDKELFFEEYNKGLHRIGRIMTLAVILLFLAVPLIIGFTNNATINVNGLIKGLASVCAIFIPSSIAEFIIYVPMLGVGGSYLSFITGNLTNMKIPCVMNARDIAGTVEGTCENEIISTISVATSAIVTTLVVAIGVVLMIPLSPILNSPALAPAFEYVVPALFGALAFKYFSKSILVAFLPLLTMSLICIFVPSMINSTSTLLIPSGAMALVIGYFYCKKK